MEIKLCVFDLDGVICDTAKYHYLAWKRLADEICIPFTPEDNERLKGVSRTASLDIILSLGKKRDWTDIQKQEMTTLKNKWYVEMICKMTKDEVLDGVVDFLSELKQKGVLTALGSASKNACIILDRLQLNSMFDYVVDGNMVTNPKPDSEVFLKATEHFNIANNQCAVFEDSIAGIVAAQSANMYCVGVGNREILYQANFVIDGFRDLSYEKLVSNLSGI